MHIVAYVDADSGLEACTELTFIVFIRLVLLGNVKCLPLLNVPFVNDVTNRNAVATIMSRRSTM